MTDGITFFRSQPNKMFRFDGLGAVISTVSLLVLSVFHEWIGLPQSVFYLLASIALLLSIYSLTCSFVLKGRWRLFLGVLVGGNLFYCLTSIGVMISYREELTTIGLLYFIGEKLIIFGLAGFEWKVQSGMTKEAV